MSECIFCKIVSGELPTRKVYEDDDTLAFYDMCPVAPVHILMIPKIHISSILMMQKENQLLFGKICYNLQKVARDLGLDQNGFRIVNNTGEQGGQTVHHIHFHLIGGRNLSWPPG